MDLVVDKLTVIVPVYKTEPYLKQCLDSIANQTHQELEIIVIDDGSPDNSGAICDEYAQKDPRFRVVHKANGGLSAAWNDAIKLATGNFITFVDSDDWIDNSFFEDMLQVPDLATADVILGNRYFEDTCDENTVVVRESFSEPFSFRDGEGKEWLQIRVLTMKDGDERYQYIPFVWNKIYKTSFIQKNKLVFDEKIRAGLFNDALFTYRVFGKARNVYGVICTGYHYRRMNSAGTRRFDPDRPAAMHYVLDQFNQYMNMEYTSPDIWAAFYSQAIRGIRGNLGYCFFHPQNNEDYWTVARKITEMKKMPRYNEAIYAPNSKYLTFKQKVLKFILRQPLIWPLWLLFAIRQRLG